MKKIASGIMIAGFVFMGAMHAPAQEDWQISITPYAFLPAVDAHATVAGQTVPIDMSFGDVWDDFDVMGLSLRAEGWKDQLGWVADGMWVNLDGDFGPEGSIGVEIEEYLVDVLGGYRLAQEPGGAVCEILSGLRYHSLKQEISAGPAPTLGGSEDWVELVIGARANKELNDKWTVGLRGDVGGFGIGSASDLTWSLTGGFDWKFAESWSAKIGYRHIDMDYSKGSSFGFDGSQSGLWLGLTWRK